MSNKQIAIIGCGPAGLCAAKNSIAQIGAENVTVFEQTSQLGGTWVYSEETGTDSSGLPVHSAMYKNLRPNSPKEVMQFPGFPHKEREESYVPTKDFLQYIHDYADNFDLKKTIKFSHRVDNVTPLEDNRWNVEVTNLKTNVSVTQIFDGILICTGRYHTPKYPVMEGLDTFPGLKMHSYYYRVPEKFKDLSVLIIGGGPSGLDIGLDLSPYSIRVVISHHEKIQPDLPSNIIQKPDIVKIENKTIFFTDDSTEDVDVIIYCTGYNYNFPFLSEECGVTVKENFVQPLFKHLIHINHPTMCFIGIPLYVCALLLFDLQTRVYLKFFCGEVKLPSKEEMMADLQRDIELRQSRGQKREQFHKMGLYQDRYYDELSAVAKVPSIPSVYSKIHNISCQRFMDELLHFRDDVYKITDEENYVLIQKS